MVFGGKHNISNLFSIVIDNFLYLEVFSWFHCSQFLFRHFCIVDLIVQMGVSIEEWPLWILLFSGCSPCDNMMQEELVLLLLTGNYRGNYFGRYFGATCVLR